MRRFLLIAPLVAMVAACSTTTEEAPASSDDALVSGGICSTLDYGPRESVDDTYRFYANDQEVSNAINSMLQSGVLAGAVGPQATLRGVNADERAVRLVKEVFEGFKKAFPMETAGLDKAPPVAVIQSNAINAFAMAATYENGAAIPKSPWFFVVLSGLLDHGNTDDELRAVFAHEIGHLVLQTFQADVQARVRHAYTLGNASEDGIIGEAQADDPTIAPQVGRLLGGQSRVGGVVQLGMNILAPGVYLRILGSMMQNTPACQAFQAKAQALAFKQYSFLPGVSEGDLTPRIPNATEQADLNRASDAAVAALRTCLAPTATPAPLSVVSALLQGLQPTAALDPSDPSFAQVQAGMLPIERQIDEEMPTASFADRLIEADARVRADLTALRADPSFNISRVRVYDFEEDADDASMRVLHAIGVNPEAMGSFALSILKPATKATCVADVAAHKPISFGDLYDVHPASCWRYYHAQQFSKALGTCGGPTPASKRAPVKSSLPLITNDPTTIGGFKR